MPFHKHPINFDVCKYLTHCSGLKSSYVNGPEPSYPYYLNGPGRAANAKVVKFDGTTLNTGSLFIAGNVNASRQATFISVFSHLLDSVKYFYITQNSKINSYLKSSVTGQIAYDTGQSSATLSTIYVGQYPDYAGSYGLYVYYNGTTRIMCGLTSEDFDEEKNDYTLVNASKSGQSYIYTDIMFNSNNGNTQIRLNFTATVTSDTTIKGLVLYTVMHESSGGYNMLSGGAGENAVNSTKVTQLYMINLGYVEFDKPIDARANVPFTVDVIFEYET